MPCVEWFKGQDSAYRQTVLPPSVRARVAVEAGIALGWREFVGECGEVVEPRTLRRVRAVQDSLRAVRADAERVAAAAKASLAKLGQDKGETTGN